MSKMMCIREGEGYLSVKGRKERKLVRRERVVREAGKTQVLENLGVVSNCKEDKDFQEPVTWSRMLRKGMDSNR